MIKQSLSGLIAISMVVVTPAPALAATSAPPDCVSSGDPIIKQAWDKASGTSENAKKIRLLIKQQCKRNKDEKKFLAVLLKYVDGKAEGSIGCLDPDNCDKAKGPIQKSGIDDIAGKITDGSGKVTEPPRPAAATPAPAPATGEKLADGPSKMDGSPPPAVPLREPPAPAAPAPRFVAASDTNLSQNLMWGLGGALLGGVVGYMMGSNNNNNGYYNNMMPMYPRPWMPQPRPPFGMNAPPILPMMGQQPWMNRLGMGGMGGMPGMPGMINPGAPGAVPMFPGAGISPLGGYGGYGNLGGYGGLGGIGSVPNYYMPGAGQISTSIAPPILPQFPNSVPAYSNTLRPPILGGY